MGQSSTYAIWSNAVTAILITGAAGRIGTLLTRHLAADHRLTLTDTRPIDAPCGCPTFTGDLADPPFVAHLMGEAAPELVIHLAANADSTSGWDDLREPNVTGCYNLFAAAAASGCRRVVFASSVHAVLAYPPQQQVDGAAPPRPADLYGVTKAFGEALGAYYADCHELSVICLRLGWVLPRDSPSIDPRNDEFDIVLTYDDLLRLMDATIAAPETLRFGIFNGVSNNRLSRLDITDARRALGYAPRDDVFAMAGITFA